MNTTIFSSILLYGGDSIVERAFIGIMTGIVMSIALYLIGRKATRKENKQREIQSKASEESQYQNTLK